ncbi:peptide ABC transporter substrate-binding protein [Carnobacterium funditum]|uniref:peptide ABC transporter substrate-binding protein n=1 Tax=Carnobacterium funditum TaxID=2752 RepID=UPI000555BC7C|nr:peptide ABC transporter substrate-binding protein [Carnobacterium funditum]
MKQLIYFAVGMIFISGCGQSASQVTNQESTSGKNKTEQTLNLSVASELPTIDPALSQDTISFTALNQVMEGLYRLDKDEKPIPALVEGEPEVSEDRLTYQFTLKPNLKWSNGEALTAVDFEYGWKRIVDPETAANYSFVMSDIKNAEAILAGEAKVDDLGIKALNKLDLEITLEKPVENFLKLITKPTFSPQKESFVTDQGSKFGTNSDSALYNGPFILKEWDGTGLSWVYEKNDQYWDQENVSLTTVTNQVIKVTSTGLNLYNNEKIDSIALTGEFAQQYNQDPEFMAPLMAKSVYLELDHLNNPALKNKKLRTALALAISREELAESIIANGSKALGGLVTNGLVENPQTGEDFREASGNYLEYEPEKASQLWAVAQKELGLTNVDLQLVTDDDEVTKKVSQYLQNTIEKNLPGVTVSLKSVPFKSRIELGDNGDFDLLLSGWGADVNDTNNFLSLFLSGSVFNGGKYSNEKYDQLVQASMGKDSSNPDKKWGNDLAAEKILLEDAAIIPLYQQAQAMLVKSSVHNYHMSQINSVNLKYVSIE